MNKHVAKGKQIDEVNILETWSHKQNDFMVSNHYRFIKDNKV